MFLIISSKCIFLSEIYEIWDYDIVPLNDVSVSHDNEKISITTSATGYRFATINNLTGNQTNFSLEFDLYSSNNVTNGESLGLQINGGGNNIFIAINQDGMSKTQITYTGGYYNLSPSIIDNWKNKWLHIKAIFNNNTFTFEVYYNLALISSKSLTIPSTILESTITYQFINHWLPSTRYIKNLKIKSL